MVAVRAEFDQYVDAQCNQSHYCRIASLTNYHHTLQETWHVSMLFITTRPRTNSAGTSDIKLLNQSDTFLCIVLTPDIVHYKRSKKNSIENYSQEFL